MTSKEALSCTPHEDIVSKGTFRFKVWNLLENKDLVRFPRPCKGRIPNFVDCVAAAKKLSSLDIFKNAENIKVNIDKPQEPVRFAVLEENKTLLVPIPRLANGVLMKVCLPEDVNRHVLRTACKMRGINQYGKVVDQDEKIHVDMIVLGSVAVSMDGQRIGKGEGFSDLEYAVLASTGAVDDNTVLVTTVHDEQVFESLPQDLFKPFDVPVDYIITPTKVIKVAPRPDKPRGMMWNMVSDRRLQLIPLLKELRGKDMDEGKDCTLKEVDSEPEDRPRPYFRPPFPPYQRRRPLYSRQQQQYSQGSRSRSRSVSHEPRERRTRTFRRGGPRPKQVMTNGHREHIETKLDRKQNNDNKENQLNQTKPQPRKRMHRRFLRGRVPLEFSVKVSNIDSTVRVRDLKNALIEKGVKPHDITWKGHRGVAYLHFAKLKTQPENPPGVDDVIASLQGLKVKCRSEEQEEAKESLLSFEVAQTSSRVEDAGITSV
ncbi:methenyltetrahydrofolate synthase domain-containing protein isoform X2 [Macrosteles quadrilineatus]|uniref:methenyltetrahydrofolate synthase domain-containing protein isoform X2 n=1 Tax=Macrosteles quadrilineatus TaxID=74068 RepID=UPI0023E275B7|nr:methenyltetrahydrofolate synthase domain-containing protein isoform X2 [Macrosteles quadrilineatus]